MDSVLGMFQRAHLVNDLIKQRSVAYDTTGNLLAQRL
jgi:hypothetical protein